MATNYQRLGGGEPANRSVLNTSVNTSTEESGSRIHYRVYKRRWYVLAVLCVLNISNAMAWITVAPVADKAAAYFGVSLEQINWLSIIFGLGIPVGFIASWVLDTYGLRTGLLLGAWLNIIGLVIRYISSVHKIIPSDYSFSVVIVGQSICAIAQPFLLFAPTKLAAQWFPDNHRAIANTIGSTSNPFGLLVAFALCSVIVKNDGDIPNLLLYFTIPGAVGALMVTLGMWSSIPPTPPSASAADRHESFFQGLKKIIRSGPFILLVICFGAGFALFSTVTSIVEEILCARGYNDSFSDLCGALMIGCGMVGALIAGLLVDKYRNFEEMAKIGFAMTSLSFIVFAVFSHMRDKEPYIITSLSLLGLFGFGIYPVCLELGVECVYPVSEGTSAGFMAMSGQVQGMLLIFVYNGLSTKLSPAEMQYQQCNGTSSTNGTNSFSHSMYSNHSMYSKFMQTSSSTQPMDTTVTVLVYAGYLVLATVIFILFFRTEYKRMRAEHFSAADHVLNYSSRNIIQQNRSIYS
ncbi:solute carrier family 49 member A3-like isoform X2 [Amphiura filiformis]|uniref:solute carrier family 49 member A3-like isoform X2 n=1 Tax=Amphiura filiformis TaxID=82378 RepID=UPI003B20F22E